jgi:hypothetical protein
MNDLLKETLVPLGTAGRHVPLTPHRNTLYRWAIHGVDGIRLETLRIGKRRYTTLEALGRFLGRLNSPAGGT